jgi:TonB family protein
MAAHRSSGDTDVRLSRQTKDSMHRNHVDSLKAVVQLCVDATGLVTDSALTARAGYTEFDSRVIEAVRGWQYQPYLVDGAPVAMCSTVDFVYHLPQ